MAAVKKFLGCPYPLVVSSRGLMPTQSGVNQIKSDLLCLLLTNPGERVFLLDYGTPLNTLMFEPNDITLATTAREMIIASINLFEPRIAVSAINVFNGADPTFLSSNDTLTETQNILTISIMFSDPENIQDVQELRLEMPLASQGT